MKHGGAVRAHHLDVGEPFTKAESTKQYVPGATITVLPFCNVARALGLNERCSAVVRLASEEV